jgi:hypothetical protein
MKLKKYLYLPTLVEVNFAVLKLIDNKVSRPDEMD